MKRNQRSVVLANKFANPNFEKMEDPAYYSGRENKRECEAKYLEVDYG